MNLSTNQQLFLDTVMAGQNVFLSGKAGTGKSTVTKIAMEELRKAGKKVAAVAPTGIAANNVGGQTIHSLFGIPPFGVLDFQSCNFIGSDKRRLLDAIDVLFIDEVSMLRPDLLDAMNWTLLKNKCKGLHRKQIVFVGDFKQLPPVLNDNTLTMLRKAYQGERMQYAAVYKKLNVATIELDEVLRQSNNEFIEALNLCRDGIKTPYFKKFVGQQPNSGVILAPHNATVLHYNETGLKSLPGEEQVYNAVIEGDLKPDDFNLEAQIRVKHGAKVMYLINSKDAPLFNGTLGTFKLEHDYPYITVDGEDYALDPVKFTKKEYVLDPKKNELKLKEIGSIKQLPIRLAYALSIHKSQGMTFDEVTVDLKRPCFQSGQMYVALSRVRTPEGLRILV